MSERPTKKQKELLSFIDGFIKGNGYGPSYREIMRALDYKSVSTVATHVNGLITRGWLVKKDNAARTLEVLMPNDNMTPVTSVGTQKAHTTEQEIRAKLDELLGQDNDAHAADIEALRRTLVLLGYNKPGSRLV
jgi:SOS-response transcriptional repressor LexA